MMSGHEVFHATYNLHDNFDFSKAIIDICTFPMEENDDQDIYS